MYTSKRIYCLKDNYHIVLTKKIIKDDAELHWDVKKVIKMIISLLKDRVEANDSLDYKRTRMKKFIKK